MGLFNPEDWEDDLVQYWEDIYKKYPFIEHLVKKYDSNIYNLLEKVRKLEEENHRLEHIIIDLDDKIIKLVKKIYEKIND